MPKSKCFKAIDVPYWRTQIIGLSSSCCCSVLEGARPAHPCWVQPVSGQTHWARVPGSWDHLNFTTCNFFDAVTERRENNGEGLQPGPTQPGTSISSELSSETCFHLDVKVSFEGFPPLSATLASGVKYNTLPCRFSPSTQCEWNSSWEMLFQGFSSSCSSLNPGEEGHIPAPRRREQ